MDVSRRSMDEPTTRDRELPSSLCSVFAAEHVEIQREE
jgi:hypothetical protein